MRRRWQYGKYGRAWKASRGCGLRGQPVAVHGCVYGLRDGLLKNLDVTIDCRDTVVPVFAAAIKRYPRVARADAP